MRQTKLRWIVSGAEPVPRAVIARAAGRAAGLPGRAGLRHVGVPDDRHDPAARGGRRHAGSAGRPRVDHADSRSSSTTARSPTTGEGEILLRSPATMRGYYNRPDETAAAFADGWFHTGDLGRLDEEGFLEITGRKKDMIISGGLNVYPKEVEEVLYRIDGDRRGRRRRRPRRQVGRGGRGRRRPRRATSTRPPSSRPAASGSRATSARAPCSSTTSPCRASRPARSSSANCVPGPRSA